MSARKPRVYVVQEQHKRDRKTGKLVPKFDLGSAAEFGHIHYLLSPTASPFNPAPIIEQLHYNLAKFKKKDFLLLIGNPVLIGLAVAKAADNTDGDINVLQWSGTEKRYISVSLENIFSNFGNE